jgi:glycine/D-amino acid oxidase-like deaminating enzyme
MAPATDLGTGTGANPSPALPLPSAPMPDPTYEPRPYWHATMPDVPRFDGRSLPERADVVVIGGGYTGLVAALGLARSGARITVLEKEHLGWGASTRNGGIVHAGLKWGRDELVRAHGQALGRAVFRAGVEAFFTAERFVQDEGFDCDYRRSGLAILAWSTRHLSGLTHELEELSELGITGRALGRTDVRDEVGSDHYPGGIVIEESGMIHPGRYFAGIASAVIAAGADLHTGVAARRVDLDGADRVVHTDRGAIRAGAVLLATNGYTDGAVPWVRQRVMPIGSYIVATEPMSEELAASVSPRGRTFFDSKNFLYYWHVNADRRLIFGGRASFRPTSTERTASILTRALATVHPQASHLRIDYAWGGNVGFTFDRLPHLGEHDGIHYALGYCGSGLALGTTFGLRMARMLGRGAEVADERSPFELTPFPAAPIVPAVYRGRPWFLAAAGEWFRIEDWWSRRQGAATGAT